MLYRLYRIGLNGRLAGIPAELDCADDQEAMREAEQTLAAFERELWQATRLVARLPTTVPSRASPNAASGATGVGKEAG